MKNVSRETENQANDWAQVRASYALFQLSCHPFQPLATEGRLGKRMDMVQCCDTDTTTKAGGPWGLSKL